MPTVDRTRVPATLSPKRLHELFVLDTLRWRLVWKARPPTDFKTHAAFVMWNNRFAHRDAGAIKKGQGYLIICIDNVRYRAHHLIWLMAKGELPHMLDHIDGDRANNSLENLREVDDACNAKNRGVGRNSPLGISGVTKGPSGAYLVKININKEQTYLGSFRDLDEAIQRRRAAEAEHGYHPNHGVLGRRY